MTRIIDRYILRQYLVPLTYILSAFCLMYVIIDLFERFPNFLQAGVPVSKMLQYYGYYLFAGPIPCTFLDGEVPGHASPRRKWVP